MFANGYFSDYFHDSYFPPESDDSGPVLTEGTLIYRIPFMSRVFEISGLSRVFRIPHRSQFEIDRGRE